MTDADLARQAWAELAQTTIDFARWRRQGYTPGHWANAKALLDRIGGWQVAAPGSTGGQVTSLTGVPLPVNVYQAPAQLADYLIDGSADSAVIVQPGAAGSALRRFRIDPCTNLAWQNAYGRHGVYAKAAGLLLEDFWVRCTPGYQVKQCFSLRMVPATLRRFHGEGAPFIIGFFQEDDAAGDVLCEHGTGSFTADTAVWLDAAAVGQRFVLRDLDVTGAGAFVKAGPGFAGTVIIDGCRLNGAPVTTATALVPAGQLTIF